MGALVLALSATSLGCAGEDPLPRPPIVLIVLDTLRADHLGAYGAERSTSPRIDELAGRSLVFERATSTAPWTNPSMAALFTGEHPAALGIREAAAVLPAAVPTLTETLSAAGYQTFGVVSHIYVGEKLGFARGFERWNEEHARGHHYVSSAAVTDAALAQLDGRDPERPFFLFVHYFDAHYQYLEHEGHRFTQGPPREGVEALSVDELRGRVGAGQLAPGDLRRLADVYDSEVSFVDHHVGRLLDELERQGLYDASLVVLTADHGEALGDHGWVGHTRTLYQELVRTPLLVKLPGSRESTRVAASVSTRDVYPTLVDHLRLRVPGQADAAQRSLLNVEDDRPAFSETQSNATLQSVTLGPWKLVHDTSSGAQRLFDLASDPGESRDRAAAEPTRVAELEALRRAWDERNASVRRLLDANAPELSEAELEQLRLLGYAR